MPKQACIYMDPKVRRDLTARGSEARMWVGCPVTGRVGRGEDQGGPQVPHIQGLAQSIVPAILPLSAGSTQSCACPWTFPLWVFAHTVFGLEPSSNINSLVNPSFHKGICLLVCFLQSLVKSTSHASFYYIPLTWKMCSPRYRCSVDMCA